MLDIEATNIGSARSVRTVPSLAISQPHWRLVNQTGEGQDGEKAQAELRAICCWIRDSIDPFLSLHAASSCARPPFFNKPASQVNTLPQTANFAWISIPYSAASGRRLVSRASLLGRPQRQDSKERFTRQYRRAVVAPSSRKRRHVTDLADQRGRRESVKGRNLRPAGLLGP